MSEPDSPPTERDRSHILRGLVTLDQAVAALERFVLASAIIVMAAVMGGHVLARQLAGLAPELLGPILGGGIPGYQEIAEVLIIVTTFAGISYAAGCARHISMAAIYDQLSGAPRKVLLLLICLGTAALMFYLAWQSLLYVRSQQDDGGVYQALQIEKWRVYAVLPVGFGLAGLRYLLTALRNLTSAGMWRSLTEREAYAGVPRGGSGSGQI